MRVRIPTLILAGLLSVLLFSTGAATSASIITAPDPVAMQPTEPIADQHEPVLRLRIGTFDPQRVTPLDAQSTTFDATLRLVQFSGPIQDAWYEELINAGLEVVTYIPDYAYLVWGTAGQMQQARNTLPVRWSGAYYPIYAIHPALRASTEMSPEQSDVEIAVQIYEYPGARYVLAQLHALASRVLRPAMQVQNITVIGLRTPVSSIATIASLPGVISVEPLMYPELLDEVQGQIMAGNVNATGSQPSNPGYLDWLTSVAGFSTDPTDYPIVDVTDDGIDDGDATPIHADFYELGDTGRTDRLTYNKNWTSDTTADGGGGHGNLNVSIVGGYNANSGWPYEDTGGYNYGLGINPFGRIAGSKIFNNAGDWAFPDYNEIVGYAYNQGARILSNSWGDSEGVGEYLIDDRIYDGLVRDASATTLGQQPMTIIFSAGNGGPGGSTIGSPGNAKNVITVGASENYRPTWTDGCGVGTSGANNANDIISFSSRGPTADGRAKPDLVAPGTHIQGAASQSPNYTGIGVCDKYHPAGQTLYASSSGTSHSAPAVAGAASLLTRFYQDTFGAYPSPAMLKAYLINAARYLDGVSSGDTLPSNNQGYGLVDLGLSFDDTPRIVRDQTTVFSSTAQSLIIEGSVAFNDRPFRVTLVWTDAPGSTIGASYVNNLNLSVTVSGETYQGNVFSGAYSAPGGSADFRNNVESVFLPPGTEGAFSITITSANVAGDGVPGNGDPTDQDFALICYNCQAGPTFRLSAAPTAQSICRPDDATYAVSTEAVAGFSGAIALATSGQPAGVTVSLTPNPVPVGDTSTLTLTDTATAAPGDYRITITGTAAALIKSTFVDLRILSTAPAAPILLAPAQGAQDIPLQPTLLWSAVPGAEQYTVEIATTADFLSPIYSAKSSTAEHAVQTPLPPLTQVHWRITAHNACGTASAVGTFTTAAPAAVYCAAPHAIIPDDNPTGVQSRVTVPFTGTLDRLRVAITVTHSWVGDLAITLEHVDTGEVISLLNRPGVTKPSDVGCMGNDFYLTLDDAGILSVQTSCQSGTPAYAPGTLYRPHEPLGTFSGSNPLGEWELHIEDQGALEQGVLEQWCLFPTLNSGLSRRTYLPLVLRLAP